MKTYSLYEIEDDVVILKNNLRNRVTVISKEVFIRETESFLDVMKKHGYRNAGDMACVETCSFDTYEELIHLCP
jgi:hypothetical protein